MTLQDALAFMAKNDPWPSAVKEAVAFGKVTKGLAGLKPQGKRKARGSVLGARPPAPITQSATYKLPSPQAEELKGIVPKPSKTLELDPNSMGIRLASVAGFLRGLTGKEASGSMTKAVRDMRPKVDRLPRDMKPARLTKWPHETGLPPIYRLGRAYTMKP